MRLNLATRDRVRIFTVLEHVSADIKIKVMKTKLQILQLQLQLQIDLGNTSRAEMIQSKINKLK